MSYKTTKITDWLLWWKVDEDELDRQATGYGTLPFLQKARGRSVACLGISIALTILLVGFSLIPMDSLYDAALMAVLAVFIYRGHKWAMIGAMVLWTAEKGALLFGLFPSVGSREASPSCR